MPVDERTQIFFSAEELDDNVLDNVDRAGARFDALGRQLLDG